MCLRRGIRGGFLFPRHLSLLANTGALVFGPLRHYLLHCVLSQHLSTFLFKHLSCLVSWLVAVSEPALNAVASAVTDTATLSVTETAPFHLTYNIPHILGETTVTDLQLNVIRKLGNRYDDSDSADSPVMDE